MGFLGPAHRFLAGSFFVFFFFRSSSSAVTGGKAAQKIRKMEDEPKFPAFPYEPYSIQIDFMKALYRSLNEGGVSMLESPTGETLPHSLFAF